MQKNLYECTVNLELCTKDQGISAWVDTVEYKKENIQFTNKSYLICQGDKKIRVSKAKTNFLNVRFAKDTTKVTAVIPADSVDEALEYFLRMVRKWLKEISVNILGVIFDNIQFYKDTTEVLSGDGRVDESV